MGKSRLEAFSDGVLAIIITIMVLELKVPHGEGLDTLAKLVPIFLSYVLSFVYIGIYWNNHHHLMHTVKRVSGSILWANLHLLFWLSLVPFSTGWMGENHFGFWPVVLYLINLLLCAIAYTILVICIQARHGGAQSELAQAIGKDNKGKLSLALYIAGIAASWISPWMGIALATIVALIWLVPDRRIEAALNQD
jgi:uncharacterized membrane protein